MPGKPPRRVRVERGVYRRPDGRLEIGWRDASGRLRWKVVDGGITAARRQLAIAKGQRAQDIRPAADPRLTFSQAADAWLDTRVARLRPNTQTAYRAHLVHLSSRFGNQRLAAMTPTAVATAVAEWERAGVAGHTARARLVVLSGVFRYAQRHLGHTANPVAQLDRVERPTVQARPQRILSDDELVALIAAASDEHRLMLAIAAQTGARKGEVLGLTWADVDTTAKTLRINRQLDRQGRRVEPKTRRSRRTIAITPGLAADLVRHRLAQGRPGDDVLVLRRRDGSRYSHQAADRALRAAVTRAGITPAPTMHDLRHSHASRLLAARRDPAYVAARLGDTVAMVLHTYAHAMPRRADESDELAALYDRGNGNAMETADGNLKQRTATTGTAEPPSLSAKRNAAQQRATPRS